MTRIRLTCSTVIVLEAWGTDLIPGPSPVGEGRYGCGSGSTEGGARSCAGTVKPLATLDGCVWRGRERTGSTKTLSCIVAGTPAVERRNDLGSEGNTRRGFGRCAGPPAGRLDLDRFVGRVGDGAVLRHVETLDLLAPANPQSHRRLE